MSYPSNLPSYQGFIGTDTLATDNHAAQHNQEQADITAIATKVGTGSATPTNATVLRGNGTGTTTFDQVHLATDVSGTLGISNGGTGVTSTTGTGNAVLSSSPSLSTPSIYNPTITSPTIAGYATVLALIYPIGCIYTETTGVNPGTTFGFGTWSAFAAGQVLVGNGTSDQAFVAGATGGESNHTLTSNEMPAHTHTIGFGSDLSNLGVARQSDTGGSFFNGNTGSTGGGAAHNNLQPYIVAYYWQRIA